MRGVTADPNRTKELGEILWAYIEEFERVRHLRKRPSVDKMIRVSHAVSQLAGMYLKVVETDAALRTVPELQAQVQELIRASRNGHRHTTALADLN
jgi:hypothetical protein